jgi:hypothetical protein
MGKFSLGQPLVPSDHGDGKAKVIFPVRMKARLAGYPGRPA